MKGGLNRMRQEAKQDTSVGFGQVKIQGIEKGEKGSARVWPSADLKMGEYRIGKVREMWGRKKDVKIRGEGAWQI